MQKITEVRYSRDYWFTCVDTVVLFDDELSKTTKMVYVELCVRAGIGSRMCDDDPKPIADVLGIRPSTVERAFEKLEDRGVIERFGDKYIWLVGHNAPCYEF